MLDPLVEAVVNRVTRTFLLLGVLLIVTLIYKREGVTSEEISQLVAMVSSSNKNL